MTSVENIGGKVIQYVEAVIHQTRLNLESQMLSDFCGSRGHINCTDITFVSISLPYVYFDEACCIVHLIHK